MKQIKKITFTQAEKEFAKALLDIQYNAIEAEFDLYELLQYIVKDEEDYLGYDLEEVEEDKNVKIYINKF